MRRSTTRSAPEVAVATRGVMPADCGDYARRKVAALARETAEPILYARVRLTHAADPALPRPAIAQANLDVNGRPLRAHVAGTTMHEAMDYDFHLFTDAESGLDSVLYRTDGVGYRLAQTDPRPAQPSPVAVPLTISEQPAPRLGVHEAVVRLNLTGFPFVFFVNDTTRRGNLLYHRYDGHYGLIVPAG